MQSVRWLPLLAAAPDLQMALDKVLLAGSGPPTLRFFTWSPPGISLGWFQRDAQEIAALRRHGLPLVRRQTGGGAIVHWHEITWSLSAPADHPLTLLARPESYARVHAAFISVLRELGVSAAERGSASHTGKSPLLCFDRATDIDVVAGGRKLMGSAQRRTRTRLLHHGSLILRRNPLQPDTAAVEDFTTDCPAPQELAARFAQALEPLLGALGPAAFSADEWAEAERARAMLVL